MTENSHHEEWVTLKEAALMLNCSVKTIRRRVEAGKLKSMVEYRGNRAIRLVSRSDVLQEAPPLEALLPPGTISEGISLGSHDTHAHLEMVVRQSLHELANKANQAQNKTRLYIILTAGLLLFGVGGLIFFILGSQTNILGKKLEGFKHDISGAFKVQETISRIQTQKAQQNARVARVLGEASLQELEASRNEVIVLRNELASLQADLAQLQTIITGLDTRQGKDITMLKELIQSYYPTPSPSPEQIKLATEPEPTPLEEKPEPE